MVIENKTAVPRTEELIKPVLMALQNKGGEASIDQIDDEVIRIMGLPDEVVQVMHGDSGTKKEVSYRMAWVRTYLKKCGFIQNKQRGVWSFTDKFDGDIDKIDVDEIVPKTMEGDMMGEEPKQGLKGFESVIAFENMAGSLLRDYAQKRGGLVYHIHSDKTDFGYDMVLLEGGDSKEEVKCIFKYCRDQKRGAELLYRAVAEKSIRDKGKYLLLTNIMVEDNIREKFSEKNVAVWDKSDLLHMIDPEADYAQYLINPKRALIEDIVDLKESKEQDGRGQESFIEGAKKAYRNQDMVLFLGAGVSRDGGIPVWPTLVKKLHISMLNSLTKDKALSFEEKKMIQELAFDNSLESPLLQMRYIKGAFSNEEYYQFVHEAMYGDGVEPNTKLLHAITKICMPQRSYCGIRSIITYNFDNLLEMKLFDKEIQYKVISCEKDKQQVDRLNIYHVHGYLPKNYKENSEELNLIFSEEDYHKVYRDAYSWSNLAQLNALRENTCLFIGCSLTDPNLRRLLDVAARNGEAPRHYAFMKRDVIGQGKMVNHKILEMYQRMDDEIRTAYYKALGLNIIWVDDYKEIPDILDGFLGQGI